MGDRRVPEMAAADTGMNLTDDPFTAGRIAADRDARARDGAEMEALLAEREERRVAAERRLAERAELEAEIAARTAKVEAEIRGRGGAGA